MPKSKKGNRRRDSCNAVEEGGNNERRPMALVARHIADDINIATSSPYSSSSPSTPAVLHPQSTARFSSNAKCAGNAHPLLTATLSSKELDRMACVATALDPHAEGDKAHHLHYHTYHRQKSQGPPSLPRESTQQQCSGSGACSKGRGNEQSCPDGTCLNAPLVILMDSVKAKPSPSSPSTLLAGSQLPSAQSAQPPRRLKVADAVSTRKSQAEVATRQPRDFFFIRMLGEGSFSTVYYSKEVESGDDYAIKVLSKTQIKREDKVNYVIREKDIMATLTYSPLGSHPFIVKLYCTFQDRERLYFVMTYAKHGELLDWLHRLGSFDGAVSLFYASEILSALEFLHQCRVIHRDLKPENILIGADWHILLSDFGTAKIIGEEGEDDPLRLKPALEEKAIQLSKAQTASAPTPKQSSPSNARSSFVGTAQYISPEVLKSSETVGPECDYWALGAIIYQMVSGQPPFRAVNEYQILRKILTLEYTFPEGFPQVAKDLVSRLLVYAPLERLGATQMGGVEVLKRHPYFASVDWERLAWRTPPELKPYLPAQGGEPAFYSDYHLPENMEPGLNEAALNRLMGLGLHTSTNTTSGTKNFAAFEDYRKTTPPNHHHHPHQHSRHSRHHPTTAPSVRSPAVVNELAKLLALNGIEKEKRLGTQRHEHKYHRFVEDHLILRSGLIDKKKGLFARRRMFLLTEGPRLFYVDPVNMDLKGEVPFSAEMRTEAKNFRTFFVHTPKRTYYLFDPGRHAKDWCDAIDTVREKYFLERCSLESNADMATLASDTAVNTIDYSPPSIATQT